MSVFGDALDGWDRARLEKLLETERSSELRCTWRPGWSQFVDALVD
jgi:hypothetical protein